MPEVTVRSRYWLAESKVRAQRRQEQGWYLREEATGGRLKKGRVDASRRGILAVVGFRLVDTRVGQGK
jgi:hypothetical protein